MSGADKAMFRAKDLEFKIWIAPSRFLFEQPVCDHIFGGFPENKKQQQNPPQKKNSKTGTENTNETTQSQLFSSGLAVNETAFWSHFGVSA